MGDRTTDVLCIAAHPDDEVLGPGGTLLRHVAEGDRVRVLIVCSGFDLSLRMDAARLADAERVADQAGWELILGHQPTLALDIAAVTALVERELGGAEAVYTHHADLNRDHRTVLEAVKVATRPFISGVRSLRTFHTPSASEWGEPFAANHFVAVDPEAKLGLLEHYRSELRPNPHPRSPDGVLCHAEFWGRSVGLAAAEPFHTLWERR